MAVSRTPSARGRINKLIVSIMIRTGIRGVGVPSGRRWPRATVGWLRIPIIIVANQRGTARPIFRDSWVVGVNVYGRSPNMFSVRIKIIREVRIIAHLCPPGFRGVSSCCVKVLINQLWMEISRLFR